MKNRARLLFPNPDQLEFRAGDREASLPEGHHARLVWGYVEQQDMARFHAGIRAVQGGVSRAAMAQEISRPSEAHDASRWLCGGVQADCHALSDFRKHHGEALDGLLGVVGLKADLQSARRGSGFRPTCPNPHPVGRASARLPEGGRRARAQAA